jgi:hypothetical protein
MNRIEFILILGLLLFIGCSSDDAPAEPAVDPQIQLQTRLDMEAWFLKVLFVNTICTEASDAIVTIYQDTASRTSSFAVASAINHFNAPDGLTSRLKAFLEKMKSEEQRLSSIPERDVRIFDNLKISNQLLGKYIELISSLPDSAEQFTSNRKSLVEQLASIEKILLIEYPQSTDELDAMTTMENMDYRWFMRMIHDLPKTEPEPVEEPEVSLPTPSPTSLPLQTWRDRDGFLHMGYNPPEDAEILSSTQQVPEQDTPLPVLDEPEQERTTMIWVDENGVSHMGNEVPEGHEGKPASDIPLMISN